MENLKKIKLTHPKINYGKKGVLIVNLGTPDSTSWLDIRRYLKDKILYQYFLTSLIYF